MRISNAETALLYKKKTQTLFIPGFVLYLVLSELYDADTYLIPAKSNRRPPSLGLEWRVQEGALAHIRPI